jgi:hypothetical protein
MSQRFAVKLSQMALISKYSTPTITTVSQSGIKWGTVAGLTDWNRRGYEEEN